MRSAQHRSSSGIARTAIAFGAIALGLGTATLVWAAWDHSALNAVIEHKGNGTAAASAPCMTPEVLARIEFLKDDIALIHVARDLLTNQILMDHNKMGHAEGSITRDQLDTDMDQMAKAQDSFDERIRKDLEEIDALQAKPPCPPPEGPPPPPPPEPPLPPAPPGPVPSSGGATREAHHVVTSCAACQSIADQINELVDDYNAAVSAHKSASRLEHQLEDYGRALNVCERKCSAATVPQYKSVAPAPPKLPSHPKKHAKKHRVTEDNPAYMENYTAPKTSAHSATQPSEGGAPPPPPDEPAQEPSHAPDVPGPDNIPHRP